MIAKWSPAEPYVEIAWCPRGQLFVTSTVTDSGPTYGGQESNGSEICSGTYRCSFKNEIWDVPDIMIGLPANDEGAVNDPDANVRLYDLLKRAEAESMPVCDWCQQYSHGFMRARGAVGAGISPSAPKWGMA